MLAANNTPDFRTISDFRKDHLGALAGLFLQVLELCRKAGLVKLGHVALDGTKMKANASKHQAMSYGRMKEKEAQLAREVDELLKRAQEVDEEEDWRYGRDRRGDELPEELSFRESRLRKIREAKAALEAEAAAAEQAEGKGRDPSGVPADKTQRNFTDPESRIMPAPGGRDFIQGYNCQAVVDSAHQVIVAARATNRPTDKGQAVGMIQETVLNTGAVPGKSPPTRATTLLRRSMTSMPWGWTPSSLRVGLATERQSRPRPGAAYRAICRLGTGCGGSCGRNGGGNVTRCG